MDDMTMDYDIIEDDPIKKFLLHKLEEIKLNNSELEQQITRRKDLLNECLTNVASEFEQNILEVTGTWQRMLNNKWIIGIKLKNANTTGLISNVNLILRWDSPGPLTYKTKIFTRYKPQQEQKLNILPGKLETIAKRLESIDDEKEKLAEDEWMYNAEIKDNFVIVTAFNIPEFISKSNYTITGVLKYQFIQKDCQFILPNSQISVRDVINKMNIIKDLDICNGEDEAFLSALTVNEEYELIVRSPKDSYTSLKNVLEFECILKKVNVVSEMKKWFFKDGLAGDSSGLVLFLQKENDIYNLNIFALNYNSMLLFLHFLYQNLTNTIILPKEHKQVILDIPEESGIVHHQEDNESRLKMDLRNFGKSLESQIVLVEKFCNQSLDELPNEVVEQKDEIDLDVTIQNYQKFRKELADLEYASDLLYTDKIEKYTTKTGLTGEESGK